MFSPTGRSGEWNLKHEHVVVDERVTLSVERKPGESCSRVSAVEGFPMNGNLRPGQFIVGAALGSAKVSFVKMANNLVENELARLKAMKKPYTLLLSEHLDSTPTTPGSDEDALTRETPEKRRQKATNPQERTPYPARINFDTAATPPSMKTSAWTSRSPPASASSSTANKLMVLPHSIQSHACPNDSHPHALENGFATVMQWNDIGKIQQSLEKLRSQRFLMERLKGEMVKKDGRIKSLVEKNEELRSKLSAVQETVDAQNRVYGDFEVAQQSVRSLEQRLEEKEEELESLRASARATEEFLRSSVEHEKSERETERAEYNKSQELLREEIQELEARIMSEQHKGQQLTAELESTQSRAEEARFLLEDFRTKQLEKFGAQQRKLEAVETDRDQAYEKLKKLEADFQAQSATLKSTRDALSAAEQRASMLSGTVQELEESTVVLRKQILELERKQSIHIHELSERAKSSEKQLSYKLQELEETCKRLDKSQEMLHKEIAAHKSTRVTLLRKEKELGNHMQALKRLTAQNQTVETRLANAHAKMDAVHQKMLEERSRNAVLEQQLEAERRNCREWATTRLELLNQFCEEEQRMRDLF